MARDRVARLWLALLAWAAVCAASGLDDLGAWIGTPERRYGVLAWVVGAAAFLAGTGLDAASKKNVRRTTALVAAALGAWVVAELLGWEPLVLSGAGARPVATLGSSAYLGAAALLAGAVALGVAFDDDEATGWRRVGAAAASLAAVAWVAAGARAAWVGGVVGVLAFHALWRRPRRSGRQLAAIAAVALAVVGLAVLTGVADRVTSVVSDDRGGARGRVDEWRVAARVVADDPVTGVGPEGYRIAFGGAVDDAYERQHGRSPLPDRAHSAPLDVAATLGLPGLGLVLALLVTIGGRVVRAARDDPSCVAVAAGLVAYATQALFLFPLAELDPTAWLLAGSAIAAGPTASRRWLAAPSLALAAVLAGAGALGVVADRSRQNDRAARLRPDVASYHLAVAADEESVGSSASLDRAIAAVDRAGRWHPLDPIVVAERTRLLLERALRSGTSGHVASARTALEDAVLDDPRNAELLLRVGVARSLDGDDDAAEDAWRDAERLAPRSATASVHLALLYARTDRTDEARAAAFRALRREPGNAVAERLLESTDGT